MDTLTIIDATLIYNSLVLGHNINTCDLAICNVILYVLGIH